MIKERIEDRVAGWVQTYADTITKNYRDYHIHTLKGNLSGNYPEYAREQLDAIENGTANLMYFKVNTGKKYYKIVQFAYLQKHELSQPCTRCDLGKCQIPFGQFYNISCLYSL